MKIAVDFDGTIVEDAYPEVGKPRPFAIREGRQLEDAVSFCQQNGIDLYAVNKNYPEEDDNGYFCRKIDADIYIDDRSLGGLPSWGEIYHAIEGGESNAEKSKKWWKFF